MEFEPELNGIECLWNIAKGKYRKRLTEEIMKEEMNFKTESIVREVLCSMTASNIHNCAAHGWRHIFNDVRSPM